jgi:hypothetical protein
MDSWPKDDDHGSTAVRTLSIELNKVFSVQASAVRARYFGSVNNLQMGKKE